MPDVHQLQSDVRHAINSGAEHAQQWAKHRNDCAQKWVESKSPKVQHHLQQAARRSAEGVVAVTPKIQDGIDRLAPKLSQAVDEATPKLARTLEKAPPALRQAKDKVVDEYLPQLSSSLGSVAQKLGDNLDEAGDQASSWVRKDANPRMQQWAERLDGSALTASHSSKRTIEKARKAAHKATDEAFKQFQKEQKKAHKSSSKGWLIAGIVAAAGAAGVALWRAMRPRDEDLWTPPTSATEASEPARSFPERQDRDAKDDQGKDNKVMNLFNTDIETSQPAVKTFTETKVSPRRAHRPDDLRKDIKDAAEKGGTVTPRGSD